MKRLVISDLHLGNGGIYDIFAGAEALPAMLADVAPDHLIINGDGVDFLLDDEPIDGLDEERAVAQAHRIVAHCGAVFEAFGRVPQVTIRLGNHDVELALAAVQTVFREAIARGGGARVEFVLGDRAEPLVIRGARILVTHGEHADPMNRLQYRQLSRSRFRYPPGSRVVKDGLNWFKRELGARFADLVKPDVRGGALATAFVWPRATAERLDAILPGLVMDYLRAYVTTGRTLTAEGGASSDQLGPGTGEAGLMGYARLHRLIVGQSGQRFVSLEPGRAERREVHRLLGRYDCQAVIMGHTHAARFMTGGDGVYLNTGTWIPLVLMPGPEAPIEAWSEFLAALRADPGMCDRAAGYLTTRFTAALIEDAPLGVRLSLVEWVDGALTILGSTDVLGRTSPAIRVRRAEDSVDGYLPLLAGPSGVPFADRGLASPKPYPVERLPRPQLNPDQMLGPGDDANAVADTYWGVVVPRGQRESRLEALAPLIKLREAQMGGVAAQVFEVDSDEVGDGRVATRWIEQHHASIDHDERPGYMLLAGDLDEIPHALHRALSTQAMVGRLAFTRPDEARTPDLDGYAAYADKVVRYAGAAADQRRPTLQYYAVEDGTAATDAGIAALVEPSFTHFCRRQQAKLGFGSVRRIMPAGDLGAPCPEDLLDDEALRGGNVLVTLSHGLGLTDDTSRRYATQGAMCIGYDRIEADDVRSVPFLPGGLWFYIACFGAGTPSQSDYAPWLQENGDGGRMAKQVMRALHPIPFVAALPQAVLANPNGPLGVVGHVDLAWTVSMRTPTVVGSPLGGHARYDAVVEKQERVGHRPQRRFGLSMEALEVALRRTNEALVDDVRRHRPYDKAALWVAHQDMRNYVLLGDPAARIGVDP